MKWLAPSLAVLAALAGPAFAQQLPVPPPIALPEGLPAPASAQIVQYLLIITVLSLAPGIVIMVTSFTRIIIALSFLRTGLGLQTTPANLVMISLALFMTFFIMAPVFEQAWNNGYKPYSEARIDAAQAYTAMTEPFREFMLRNTGLKELELFRELAEERNIAVQDADRDLRIVVPAFMISELRRGFEIGFLIALPFLIIDIVVATVTMAMGMMMLPPTVISLPFKVLFFVLIDGWSLLVQSLVRSFNV
jgi:flagellar biosynthetic protein FliP